MELVTLKEIVELFLNTTIHEIDVENEVPRFNFLFNINDLNIFYDAINNPFKKEGFWTPDATVEDLKLLISQCNLNPSNTSLKVFNNALFFKQLRDIINGYILLCNKYGVSVSSRNIAMHIMRRIWLRMDNEDLKDGNMFLDMQLKFIRDNSLDEYVYPKIVDEICGNRVIARSVINPTYDETFRSIRFYVSDNDGKKLYYLPHINYEICEEEGIKVCYIYAVQNDRVDRKHQDKKIERTLYKLNNGIENSLTHPSRVYSVLLFLNILKENGIYNIKVPKSQVLDYRYHTLMSEREKERFSLKWPLGEVECYDKWPQDRKDEYDYELEFYNSVVDKQDIINFNKTIGLYNLMKRCTVHDKSFVLLNDFEDKSLTINFTLRR